MCQTVSTLALLSLGCSGLGDVTEVERHRHDGPVTPTVRTVKTPPVQTVKSPQETTDVLRPLPDTTPVQALEPYPHCELPDGYYRSDGTAMPRIAIRTQPTLIATGVFSSPVVSGEHLFVIEAHRNNGVPPAQTKIRRFALDTLEGDVLFDEGDGIVDPSALLTTERQLYIMDWATEAILRSPLSDPELITLAGDVGRGLAFSHVNNSLLVSSYRNSAVIRIGPLETVTTEVESEPEVRTLSTTPFPSGSAAWTHFTAWGTNGHNGNLRNELVIRDLRDDTELRVPVPGSVSSLAVNGEELVWSSYSITGSEIGRVPLDEDGYPILESADRLRYCGQPGGNDIHGSLAVFGEQRLAFWERGASQLRTLETDSDFVRDTVMDKTYVYFTTWSGLFRLQLDGLE